MENFLPKRLNKVFTEDFIDETNKSNAIDNETMKQTYIEINKKFIELKKCFKYEMKIFRVVSIALFGLVLVKFLLFDFAEISTLGKILTAISLGILLLIAAFMYERLQKILFKDSNTDENEN